ncbi:MAG: hypothetical protein WCB67_09115 [Solirubrobacteraceae bacterium]
MPRQLVPGLYHWTAFHPGIGSRVSSYYLEPADAVLDPKCPEEGWDAIPGYVRQVLLTSGHHTRDAAELADRLSIPVRASPQAADHIGGALDVEVFTDGSEAAPGITAIHIGVLSDDEGAFHIAVDDGAIAFADGLISHGDEIGFVPDELMGDDPEGVKQGLTEAFRGLLDLDFDHLLFAHGDPVIGGGKTSLRAFLADRR